jgi:ribosome-interacting GTPase 1
MTNLIRLADIALLVVDLGSAAAKQALDVIAFMSRTSTHLGGSGGQSDGQIPTVKVKTLIVGNKKELSPAEANLRELQQRLGKDFHILAVSALSQKDLEEFKKDIFRALQIVRVYTKEPGKKPDLHQPYVLKEGSTILDLAESIHRDFASNLKHARIWGSEKYDGQNVQKDHVLQDGDIIELHL